MDPRAMQLLQVALGVLCWMAAVATLFAPKDTGGAFNILSTAGTAMIMNAIPSLAEIAKAKRANSEPPPPVVK
jgi:hypothetical protein